MQSKEKTTDGETDHETPLGIVSACAKPHRLLPFLATPTTKRMSRRPTKARITGQDSPRVSNKSQEEGGERKESNFLKPNTGEIKREKDQNIPLTFPGAEGKRKKTQATQVTARKNLCA